LVFLAGSVALVDCSGSLPKSERVTKSTWPTFAAAKSAYDQVRPGLTTVTALQEMGYDPYTETNLRILNYLDITGQFLSGDSRTAAGLPLAVQSCLAARSACMGYEVNLQRIHRQRKGSAFLDLLNFRRRTHETGWKFKALFVIHHELVVYKLWSGMPKIDRRLDTKNPLGPVQEPTDVIKRQIP
jgi:hypothetical protein